MDNQLIYDVGMHNGNDTAYYLFKGYNVVAIDANPLLIKEAESRFSKEIESGQLTLLNIGISEKEEELEFWVNDSKSEWSSFDKRFGCRQNLPCHSVKVQSYPFKEILQKFGIPYYLKIDIEGSDHLCLRALQDFKNEDLPEYVSVEVCRLEWLYLIYGLGYKSFQLVNQSKNWKIDHIPGWKFEKGCSGVFGEDILGSWERNIEKVAYQWLHHKMGFPERHSMGQGWFDFHAKKA